MKKILSLLLAALMLPVLCINAYAATNSKMLHSYYSFNEDQLVALGVDLPPDGTTTITLASQENLNAEMTTIAQTELGTTVYCVVDTSSELPQQARDQEIAILREISDAMGKDDRMVIATVGHSITESEPLTTPVERKNAISGIEFSSRSTNLYQAVNNALDSLTTKTAFNFNKCLVVLSNGKDDGMTSVTEEAVLSKIEKSTIPVYGVGLLKDYPSDYFRSLTKSLERMAAASVGGKFYETSVQGTRSGEVAAKIWLSMQNSAVFLVDINGLNRARLGDTMLFTVRYTTENAVFEDSISILISDLPAAEAPSSTGTNTGTTTSVEEPAEEKFPVMLVSCIVATIAVVIVAVVLVIVKKKSRKAGSSNKNIQVGIVGPTTPVNQSGVGTTPIELENPFAEVRESGTTPKQAAKPGSSASALHLSLTVIGHKDQAFSFTLPQDQPMVIGRDNRADVILLINGETDSRLSGTHCTMQWSQGRLFVSDNRSTNGTFVNGAQVVPGSLQQLENGALLRIGSREYRVNFDLPVQH